MIEAQWTCTVPRSVGPEELRQVMHRLTWKLSSLTDRGRFFFPNDENPHGAQKLPAFRGFRHEALDCVVNAHRELAKVDVAQVNSLPAHASAIDKQRKAFIDLLSQALGPRAYRQQAELLLPLAGMRVD